jgi:hypothetical protein
VQCAAGINWKSKLNDLNLFAWSGYINFASQPIKAFAVPFIFENDEVFEDSSKDAGVIFDRPRLYRYMNNGYEENLKEDVRKWCETRLDDLLN